MAEQQIADETLATAATMAAAAVADGPLGMSAESQSDSDQVSGTNQQPADPNTVDAGSAGEAATTYLMIKELRGISRARSLRLQPEDIIVAIDGMPFRRDIESFLDIMFECDPENGLLLTIWRGVFYSMLLLVVRSVVFSNMQSQMSRKRQPRISRNILLIR